LSDANPGPLTWRVSQGESHQLCTFAVADAAGLLDHGQLAKITLPDGLDRRQGVVFSGKGPVWLYGYLTHLAHTFAWVAIADLRLGGAVVVERHLPTAPEVGEVIPYDEPEFQGEIRVY
jgi:CRISPR-associated protein Csx3